MKPSLFKMVMLSLLLTSGSVFSAMPVVDIAAGLQLANQLVELRKQAESLQKQLENLSPEDHQWGNTQNLLSQLEDNIRQSNALAYSAGDIDQRFRDVYSGYKAPKNYQEEYRRITQSSHQTFNNVLRNHGMSSREFTDENRRMSFLQLKSQSATGHLQAIQAANMMASEQVSQLQLLREAVMSQTSAQSAYYAAQIQKDAMEEAAFDEMIETASMNPRVVPLNSNPIKDPFK